MLEQRLDRWKSTPSYSSREPGKELEPHSKGRVSVHSSAKHSFYKQAHEPIALLVGRGVEGDAHCGTLLQHLYSKRKRPQALNLREVHLLQVDLVDELPAR